MTEELLFSPENDRTNQHLVILTISGILVARVELKTHFQKDKNFIASGHMHNKVTRFDFITFKVSFTCECLHVHQIYKLMYCVIGQPHENT